LVGSNDQIAVIANCGAQDFPAFDVPWAWDAKPFQEIAVPSSGSPASVLSGHGALRVSLAPFQVRVFKIV
jgi:hypothetical protein